MLAIQKKTTSTKMMMTMMQRGQQGRRGRRKNQGHHLSHSHATSVVLTWPTDEEVKGQSDVECYYWVGKGHDDDDLTERTTTTTGDSLLEDEEEEKEEEKEEEPSEIIVPLEGRQVEEVSKLSLSQEHSTTGTTATTPATPSDKASVEVVQPKPCLVKELVMIQYHQHSQQGFDHTPSRHQHPNQQKTTTKATVPNPIDDKVELVLPLVLYHENDDSYDGDDDDDDDGLVNNTNDTWNSLFPLYASSSSSTSSTSLVATSNDDEEEDDDDDENHCTNKTFKSGFSNTSLLTRRPIPETIILDRNWKKDIKKHRLHGEREKDVKQQTNDNKQQQQQQQHFLRRQKIVAKTCFPHMVLPEEEDDDDDGIDCLDNYNNVDENGSNHFYNVNNFDDPWTAAKRGDLNALQRFAAYHQHHHYDWTEEDQFGNVPLYYGCQSGASRDIAVVGFLLQQWPMRRQVVRVGQNPSSALKFKLALTPSTKTMQEKTSTPLVAGAGTGSAEVNEEKYHGSIPDLPLDLLIRCKMDAVNRSVIQLLEHPADATVIIQASKHSLFDPED